MISGIHSWRQNTKVSWHSHHALSDTRSIVDIGIEQVVLWRHLEVNPADKVGERNIRQSVEHRPEAVANVLAWVLCLVVGDVGLVVASVLENSFWLNKLVEINLRQVKLAIVGIDD